MCVLAWLWCLTSDDLYFWHGNVIIHFTFVLFTLSLYPFLSLRVYALYMTLWTWVCIGSKVNHVDAPWSNLIVADLIRSVSGNRPRPHPRNQRSLTLTSRVLFVRCDWYIALFFHIILNIYFKRFEHSRSLVSCCIPVGLPTLLCHLRHPHPKLLSWYLGNPYWMRCQPCGCWFPRD